MTRPGIGRGGEAGFSLAEVMVALTVTLIVSGALYGLLASGAHAFRREPELADRQQSIRVAMDLITRDVFSAGAALPSFAPAFTRLDPAGGPCAGTTGLNGCGSPGSMGLAAASERAPGDGGDPSPNTDVLEILTIDPTCRALPVCSTAPLGGRPGLFVTRGALPACLSRPGLVLLAASTGAGPFAVQAATATASAVCPGSSGSGSANGNLTLGPALGPWQGAVPASPAPFLSRARVVRYRIAPSTDLLDTTPALWRSESGRYDSAGDVPPEPGAPGFPGSNSPWRPVARGIEDLQLEYQTGDGGWKNQPTPLVADDWTTIVRQVRITLSARTLVPGLQGQTTAGGAAPPAVRGQLVTVVTPRASFNNLQMAGQVQ